MIEKGYLEYLQACYKEIFSYIRTQDNAVDHDKMEMFFNKTVSPYKYWLDEHKAEETSREDFDREGFLNGLKKKYKMVPTKTGLKLPEYLNDKVEFKHLAGNMRICGFEYNKEDQEFQPLEAMNHV
jgi:hypothetical protein